MVQVDDHHLRGRHARRQHQALVVAVHHDHHADRARRQAPAVLPHELALYASPAPAAPTAAVRLVADVEHAREVLAQTVRRGALDRATVRRHERLHRRRVQTARELLLLGLAALDPGHGEQLLVDARVVVKDLQHLLLRLLLRRVRAVALLPQELARADERRRVLELPAHHVRPLIQTQRQIAVAADPARVGCV